MRSGDALAAAALRIGRLDAEVLLAHLAGIERGALLLAHDLRIDWQAYDILIERRAAGEPVAYITGRREFWSLDLRVTPDVLIPRPDSETLIEAALVCVPHAPRSILDLGTGSGALLLAALSEWPAARGVGVDVSSAALGVAAGNAQALGMAERAVFRAGDWTEGLAARFDLVLSNPPYVEDGAVLARDVGDHEPALALFAGADGLDAYRRLVPQLSSVLATGGVAIIEIGATQADAVTALAVRHGLAAAIRRDLGGRDRCLILRPAMAGN